MTKPILELKNVTTVVNCGTTSQTTILKGINLTINPVTSSRSSEPTGRGNQPSST